MYQVLWQETLHKAEIQKLALYKSADSFHTLTTRPPIFLSSEGNAIQ